MKPFINLIVNSSSPYEKKIKEITVAIISLVLAEGNETDVEALACHGNR